LQTTLSGGGIEVVVEPGGVIVKETINIKIKINLNQVPANGKK
jgi:hypothetical protein